MWRRQLTHRLLILLACCHFRHALNIVVNNDNNNFALSLFQDDESSQRQEYLGDVFPFSSATLQMKARKGVTGNGKVVIYAKRSPGSTLVVHMFVVAGFHETFRFSLPPLPPLPAACDLSRERESTAPDCGVPLAPLLLLLLRNAALLVQHPPATCDLGQHYPPRYFFALAGRSGESVGHRARHPSGELQRAREQQAFTAAYHALSGHWWLSHYDFRDGHGGPRLGHAFGGSVWPTWQADFVGQLYSVPPTPAGEDRALTLRVISTSPRAFLLEGFLSTEEAEGLLALARSVRESGGGGRDSGDPQRNIPGLRFRRFPDRSSEHACARRQDHPLVERVFLRAARVFGVSEELLHPFGEEGLSKDLQFIYYNTSGRFWLHSDAAVEASSLRLATLLLYLHDLPPSAGGETAFPRGGFKVRPALGNALLYYNLLEDGNVDLDALHESLPVTHGEKWVASVYLYPTPTRYRHKEAPADFC